MFDSVLREREKHSLLYICIILSTFLIILCLIPTCGEMYSIQFHVEKFVSDLQ